MEIRQLTQDIVQWADSVFPDRKPESALLKLFEETGELVRDPTAAGEYADICIMVFDLAHMHGIDLAEAIREKLEINKHRDWTKTKTGTLQHFGEPDRMKVIGRNGNSGLHYAYDKGKQDVLHGRPRDPGQFVEDRDLLDMYNRGYDLGVGDSE